MARFHLKKGYDIPIAGDTEPVVVNGKRPTLVALQPFDFRNLRPMLKVAPGDQVRAGQVLFVDKKNEAIRFVAPVGGTIKDIVRGERRAIRHVVIATSGTEEAVEFSKHDESQLHELSGEQVRQALLEGGLWPVLRQRPYTRIADPEATPKAIFISAVDSAPLAPDTKILLQDRVKYFQAGIKVLQKLTTGKIHLSVSPANEAFFGKVEGVELHVFKGPHPAGNISVQVFHIDRLRPKEIIWYLHPVDVARVGEFFLEGRYPAEKVVALAGTGLEKRVYVKTVEGAQIKEVLQEQPDAAEFRFISGDVLTGTNAGLEGYVGFYHHQITVIPEVKGKRLFGWAVPGLERPSYLPTYLSYFTGKKRFEMDTDLNGEPRAFVATGIYEEVMPMDILPVHLAKAILVEDIELMEKLGIYEVDPEDFALCSYVCPSKSDFGEIVERGLRLMEKEG